MLNHLRLLAHYNQHMNQQLFYAAKTLPESALKEDRHAFFGSILGTLNHILVGDLIWLKRLAAHPTQHVALNAIRATEMPTRLDQILFESINPLWHERQIVDAVISSWCQELTDEDLLKPLTYHNMKGVAARKETGALILHLFNHQTHHRGQVSTLMLQAGVDVGVTDLLALIPEAH